MLKNIDFALWLPIVSAILGATLHSLQTDGGASILDHFDIEGRLPKWLLPILALVCGFGSGAVDNVISGQDLQHAIATALLATVTTFFGAIAHHAVTSPKASAVIPMLAKTIAAVTFAAMLWACAVLKKAEVIAADVTTCLVANQDLPDEDAFLKCGVQEAEKLIATKVLHESRSQSARKAVEAHDRGVHETKEALMSSGCAKDEGAK